MKNDRYRAKPDRLVNLVTNIFIIFILILLGLVTFSGLTESSYLAFSGVFVLIPITFITWGFSPQSYSVSDSVIKVNRAFGPVIIPINKISEIRPIENTEIGFSFRLFASGGLFGYFGIFSSASLGRYTMWSTNRKDLVLLICKNKKIVISPSDRDNFILNVKLHR